MRAASTLTILAGFLLATPAAAQLTTPHGGDKFPSSFSQEARVDQSFVEQTGYDRPLSADASIVRAAAWGRCVVAAAPDDSVRYAEAADRYARRRLGRELASVFAACRAASGRFGMYDRTEVKRAAISDALLARRRAASS